MDYLDPKKARQHRIVLFMGYVLLGLAILIGAGLLLQQAGGYWVNRHGKVIQNGLTFFSSQPHPAVITVNGKVAKVKTNSRILLPEGIYHVQLSRDGYRSWQRTIEVDGGKVEHFDYPFLFPASLTTKNEHLYPAAPNLATQSLDRRWLLVQPSGSFTAFDVYDLKNPLQLVSTTISLPATVLSKATSGESLQLAAWADDNRHVLLMHNFDGKAEYILLDRTNPEQSINLSTKLATTAKISLLNKKYDRYTLFDAADKTVQAASLSSPTPIPILDHVLAFQTYSTDTYLYVSDANVPAGKVVLRLLIGDKTTSLRNFPAGTTYLVDLTKYSGDLYVTASASSENKVYIYKDPVGQLSSVPTHALVPSQVLHVTLPNYVSFSNSAQFVVAENGSQFGVYDLENERGYSYVSQAPLDPPQPHANWMDGDRLVFDSAGKLTVFDFDHTNQQTLIAASSNYLPAFAPNFKYVYTVSPAPTAGQFEVGQTPLLIPGDL
jgi:hypothetical protein